MERMTAAEREEAVKVVIAEAHAGVNSLSAKAFLTKVVRIAGRLHRIYERQCNGHQKPNGDWDERAAQADEDQENILERELRQTFARMGLGLYLNGDPRGNPVGILTPKTGRYNTMGGRECGWRL